MSIPRNFIIPQGSTWQRVVTWKANGALVNLTGYTARMKVRQPDHEGAVIIELTTENGGIALGGVAGTITLTLTDTQTAALTATNTAVYDLELVSSGGVVTRLLESTVKITRRVTR